MLIFLNQALRVCVTHLRIWWRRPIEAFIGTTLAACFLLIANQVFTVTLSDQVRIGLYSEVARIEEDLRIGIGELGVRLVSSHDLDAARRDLGQGKLAALVAVRDVQPTAISLELAGRNLLLDREIASQLLRATAEMLDRESDRIRVKIANDVSAPERITGFMTASLLSFLIMTLAHVSHGTFWVRDWEHGTLFTLLATPASRAAIILGRMAAGCLLTLGGLAVAVVACRQIVSWPWPPSPARWAALVAVHVFFANAVFFAIASVCRSYRLYVNVSSFLVIVLMFVSGTIKSIEIMAPWERALTRLMPTFHAVRSMRAAMLGAEPLLPHDVLILLLWGGAGCIVGYWKIAHATIDKR